MKNLQKIADTLIKNNILIFYGRVRERLLELNRNGMGYSLINVKNGIMRAQNSLTGAWERIGGVLLSGKSGNNGFISLLAHTVRPCSKEGSDKAVDLICNASQRTRCIFNI